MEIQLWEFKLSQTYAIRLCFLGQPWHKGHLDPLAGLRGLLRNAAIRGQGFHLTPGNVSNCRLCGARNLGNARADTAYPFTADILLTLPFLIDTAGNAADFYDSIWWWDDANHLMNWALLSGAVGALAWRNNVRPWQTLAYVVGFGAVTAILWEIAEYFSSIRFSEELATAYVDTLGDMTLGLTGSVLAGLAAALIPHRKNL